jgi:hypothetical protein
MGLHSSAYKAYTSNVLYILIEQHAINQVQTPEDRADTMTDPADFNNALVCLMKNWISSQSMEDRIERHLIQMAYAALL